MNVRRKPTASVLRFGNRDMDTVTGKDGKDAVVAFTERSIRYSWKVSLWKISLWVNVLDPLANVVARLLFRYRRTVRSITTDNGSESCLCCHRLITKFMASKGRTQSSSAVSAGPYF